MKRCAVYVRVSTNREEQKASLQAQQEVFYRFIQQEGWDLYSFYVDIESGTTDKREKLQQMLEDAQQKKFDVILAKELSRLARNAELCYKIRRIALENDIDVITLDNAANTIQGNDFMFGIYATMYEQESQRMSERIKFSLRNRASKGLFKGSNPPYGYEVIDGKLHVREDETPEIVKRIYREYMSGKGFDAIARGLYNEGHPTPAQIANKRNATQLWHGGTIRLILTNPNYTGNLIQCRQATASVTSKRRVSVPADKQICIKNAHEPIISEEDFQVVQNMVASRKRIIPSNERHLFTNTAFCADCKRSMHYKENRNGYVCGSYNKYGLKVCSQHAVKERVLIQLILDDLKSLAVYLNEKQLFKKLESKFLRAEKQIHQKIFAIEGKIKKLKQTKNNYISLLADGDISKEEYREVVSSNNLEIEKLSLEKTELEKSIHVKSNIQDIEMLKRQLSTFLEFNELTSNILHRLVERIEIKADGTPIIFYRFAIPSILKDRDLIEDQAVLSS